MCTWQVHGKCVYVCVCARAKIHIHTQQVERNNMRKEQECLRKIAEEGRLIYLEDAVEIPMSV